MNEFEDELIKKKKMILPLKILILVVACSLLFGILFLCNYINTEQSKSNPNDPISKEYAINKINEKKRSTFL